MQGTGVFEKNNDKEEREHYSRELFFLVLQISFGQCFCTKELVEFLLP